MDTALTALTIASFVISGAVVALNAIAPLTKNTWDNRFLDGLVFVHDKILSVLLPFLAAQVSTNKTDKETK